MQQQVAKLAASSKRAKMRYFPTKQYGAIVLLKYAVALIFVFACCTITGLRGFIGTNAKIFSFYRLFKHCQLWELLTICKIGRSNIKFSDPMLFPFNGKANGIQVCCTAPLQVTNDSLIENAAQKLLLRQRKNGIGAWITKIVIWNEVWTIFGLLFPVLIVLAIGVHVYGFWFVFSHSKSVMHSVNYYYLGPLFFASRQQEFVTGVLLLLISPILMFWVVRKWIRFWSLRVWSHIEKLLGVILFMLYFVHGILAQIKVLILHSSIQSLEYGSNELHFGNADSGSPNPCTVREANSSDAITCN